ncbi:hypothetical protein F0562_010882 [Nyssa sinensis]|uniref:Uncharacterized protein n=1 Tax=Nyssa sinensis TaxID=561372 RepID=A0A5J5A2C8_9ASTE|nr:hypothetical protein F0562_010882 [Nyssa sinensis]
MVHNIAEWSQQFISHQVDSSGSLITEFLIDLANGNIKDKSVPSELEDKFLPGSQTLEIQDKRPSPIDVHEFLVGAFELRGSNMEKTKLLQPMIIKVKFSHCLKRDLSCKGMRSGAWDLGWTNEFTMEEVEKVLADIEKQTTGYTVNVYCHGS